MSLLRKFVFDNNLKSIWRASSSFKKVSESVYGYEPAEDIKLLEKFPKTTKEMKEDFLANGYLVVKKLITQPELAQILPVLIGEQSYFEKLGCYKQDKKWPIAFWNEQGDDVLGVLAGNAKIAGVAQDLLDRGEIYLYHGKMLRKEAKEGGFSEWHQYYAKYYSNELVLKSSHRCGRIDHGVATAKYETDPDRTAMAKQILPQVDMEMAPGDGMFLHTNLLRCSAHNRSDHLRCHLKFVYNTKRNSPSTKHDYSDAIYTKLQAYSADLLHSAQNIEVQKREWVQTEKDKFENLHPTSLLDS